MVGVAGFEPATLWSQTRCATRLRYAPKDYLYRLNELFYQLKDNYIYKIKDINVLHFKIEKNITSGLISIFDIKINQTVNDIKNNVKSRYNIRNSQELKSLFKTIINS